MPEMNPVVYKNLKDSQMWNHCERDEDSIKLGKILEEWTKKGILIKYTYGWGYLKHWLHM